MNQWHQVVHSPEELIDIARQFALNIQSHIRLHKKPIIIYLVGDLGAGKTTFSKGFLSGLGYQALVKSPTYTLVEPYDFQDFKVYHFDLYRLITSQEAEEMGMLDYFHDKSISLIEWPEKAAGYLPACDWSVNLTYQDNPLHRFISIKNTDHHD